MDDARPNSLTLSSESAFVPFRPSRSIPLPSPPTSSNLSPNPSLVSATRDLVRLYRTCNPRFAFEHLVPRRCLTNPSNPVYNNEWDNRDHNYILHVNDNLNDDHGNSYAVLDLLGTGTFGQVVKCRHNRTADVVAVKIIKNQPAYFNQAWVEINILRMLHLNNHPDYTRHIVKLLSHFVFRGHLCLVFERLSINLYELLKQNNHVGLGLQMLRSFLSQILQALNVLVHSEVIHCDLKPENILVKALDTAEVKIIDFGSACQLHYPVYSYVQSRFYRSPEVLLGWPKYDSKIDMWSLGCVTAELFLGIPLFPGQNEMNMICRIVEMLGEMPHRFLHHCRHTPKFFNSPRIPTSNNVHVYTLKPLAQYEQETNQTLPEWKRFFKEKKLRDIVMSYPCRTAPPHTEELLLRESLVDLMHGMLKVDPRERWTPSEAMQHPFLNGEPLVNGQPWTPPSRSRRVTRSRPVSIDPAVHREESIINDSLYVASAPNFNAKGHLAVPSVAASRFAPPPFTAMPAQQQMASPQQPVSRQTHGTPHSGFQFNKDHTIPSASSFAPGSYVPPPAPSMFAQQNFPTVGVPLHARAHPGSYGPTVRGSRDPRSFLYQPQVPHAELGRSYHQLQVNPQPSLPMAIGSPSGALSSTPPVSYAGTVRLGGGLHLSASRESLTGSSSLQPSASRESLPLARDASQNDLSEDPMFAFGSDDEGFSPTGPQVVGTNAPQSSTGLTGAHVAGNPCPLQGASSALPPPGPRSSFSRAAVQGNSSNFSPYGYTSNGFLSGRQARPTSNNLPPTQHAVYSQVEAGFPAGDLDMGEQSRTRKLAGPVESRPPFPTQVRDEGTFHLNRRERRCKKEDLLPVPINAVTRKPIPDPKTNSPSSNLS